MIRFLNNLKKINNNSVINCNKKYLSNKIFDYQKFNFCNKSTTTTINNNNDYNHQIDSEKIKKINNFIKENFNKKIDYENDEELKLILKNINQSTSISSNNRYFQLYKWMLKNLKIEIKLLSGEVVTTIDVLSRELFDNPNNDDARLALCFLQIYSTKDIMNSKFNQPSYQLKNSKKNNNNNNVPVIEKSIRMESYSYIELILIVLDIEPYNGEILNGLLQIMKSYNIRDMVVFNENIEIETIAIKNYYVNRDNNASCYFDLVYTCLPRKLVEFGDKEPIHLKDILIEGLEKFPNYLSKFYYSLSNLLPNNFDTIKLPKQEKELNRIEILIKSIENLIKNENQIGEENIDSTIKFYYSELSKYLYRDQEIVVNGNIENKITLTLKSIELNLNFIVDLIELMKPNQIVKIKGKEYTGIDLINEFLLKSGEENNKLTSYMILSKIYQQENNLKLSNHFKELYDNKKEELKNQLLLNFNGTPLHYLQLEGLLNNNEKVIINNEKIGKKECFIRMIQSRVDLPFILYKISTFLDGDDDKVRLYNGELLNKKQLLLRELEINRHDPIVFYEYYVGFDDGFNKEFIKECSEYDRDFLKLLYVLDYLMTRFPEFSQSYMYIGQFLTKYQYDNLNDFNNNVDVISYLSSKEIPSYFNLSKKELFKKALENKEPIYPVFSISTFNDWFNLSCEMSFNNQDIEFNKSKKEILMELLKLNSNSSGCYFELSKSLTNNNSSRINIDNQSFTKLQLLILSLDLEKGYTLLKSKILIELVKLIESNNDNNFKLELLNGRKLNKQQLIVELFEDYNFSDYIINDSESMYLIKQLINTLEFNNEDSITINSHQYTKEMLKNQILYSNIDNLKSNFFKLFK